jgi:hypothetical protein
VERLARARAGHALIEINRKKFKPAAGCLSIFSGFRANGLLKTGIANMIKCLRKTRLNPPEATAENFKFRTNEVLEERIIERGQGFVRLLSAARAGRSGADYTRGL